MGRNTIRSGKVTQQGQAASSRGGPGRPRDPATDEAILRATLELLGERGYARTSVEAVAERAGVSKPTIYLRYPSKAELATAAIAYLREQRPLPDSGSLRSDLIDELAAFAGGVNRPYGMAMIGTVLAEEHEAPELLASFRERVVGPRRLRFRELLERARGRGELAAGVDPDIVVALLVGSVYARALAGEAIDRRWATRTVETVLTGITS